MSKIQISTQSSSDTGLVDRIVPIAPHDDSDLPGGISRSLYVGGGGDVVIIDAFGERAVLVSGDNQYHPLRIRRVLAEGTTATNLLALY